tara:strand:- start:50 stop:625 length:576 start_codon:yes stop_codon:yes gene_type:complete
MKRDIVEFCYWKQIFLDYSCSSEYCLDKNDFTNNCWNCHKHNSRWVEIKKYIKDEDIKLVPFYGDTGSSDARSSDARSSDARRRGWSSLALKIHPLVEKKMAYWTNDNTLLLGYKLKNSDQIFRPIFSGEREERLSKVRLAIKKYVGQPEEGINCIGNGFIRRLRQNMYGRVLLGKKILPEDVISYICDWI